MKIKYDITRDDYLKFNMYHLENSPKVKKELIIHRIVVPLLLVGLGFALHVLVKFSLVTTMPIFIIAAVVWSIVYPKFYKKVALKNVSKMLERGVQSESISRHSLSLKDEGILSSSNAGQAAHKWSDIVKFHEAENHLYIYITDKIAHVVPKRAFKDKEEETQFINIIKEHIN